MPEGIARAIRRVGKTVDRFLRPFADPRRVASAAKEIPWYVRSLLQYSRATTERLNLLDLYPCLGDRHAEAGTASGDYFHQDLWAARKVFHSGVAEHVDVGSRVDGFIAHCAVFTRVIYVDARPLPGGIGNIETRLGHLGNLPFADRSLLSLSCLHVVEHVGLGRYGDPIDPSGTHKSLADLRRVLGKSGNLYLGLPIGRDRTCFNAHRITNPGRVLEAMAGLDLVEFSAVNSAGHLVNGARPEDYSDVEYGCGLFHFRSP